MIRCIAIAALAAALATACVVDEDDTGALSQEIGLTGPVLPIPSPQVVLDGGIPSEVHPTPGGGPSLEPICQPENCPDPTVPVWQFPGLPSDVLRPGELFDPRLEEPLIPGHP
jgi:hypothetical protein